MIRHYCDNLKCGKDITDEGRYYFKIEKGVYRTLTLVLCQECNDKLLNIIGEVVGFTYEMPVFIGNENGIFDEEN